MNQTQSVFPKVSVIIPVWNPGSGISRCIESLRGQTLEEIELIFVDDCGTDGAMEIVRAAAAEDPRIRIITNAENMGAGASRNTAIEMAQGEYFSFVDADDYIARDFLAVLFGKGYAENLDIVKGRIVYESEDGNPVVQGSSLNKRIQQGSNDGKPLFFLFRSEFQSAIYHRRLFANPCVRFGLSAIGEDSTFLLKACHLSSSFEIDGRATYYYVCRKSSASCAMTAKSLDDRISTLSTLFDYADHFMAPSVQVSCYFIRKLKYYVSLQCYVSQMAGMEEAASQFNSKMQALAISNDSVRISKDNDIVILALVDYGECLAEWPHCLPWEVPQPDAYYEVVSRQAGFLIAHPQYYKLFPKIKERSELFVKYMQRSGIPSVEIDKFQAKVRTLWNHPSILKMRLKNNLHKVRAIRNLVKLTRRIFQREER